MFRVLLLFAALTLASPAAANVSRLMQPDSRAGADLARYERIVVMDFEPALERVSDVPEKAAAQRAAALEGGREIAEGVVERLRASGEYAEVSRKPLEGEAVVLRGRITAYRDANLLQRAVGLFQGPRLEAEIEAIDAESGERVGRLTLDFSGSLRPGSWTSLIRTNGGFINGSAARITDELLIATGKRAREETGRAGRLREKYRSGD
jgi:hypothetical protein